MRDSGERRPRSRWWSCAKRIARGVRCLFQRALRPSPAGLMQTLNERILVDDFDAQRLGTIALTAAARAGDDVRGALRHGAGDLPAETLDERLDLVAGPAVE